MAHSEEVRVPDIGDFDAVDVIEILVSEGDTVAKEQSLITLESDKASLEVPAPMAGTVRDIKVAVGDQIAEGSLILTLEPAAGDQDETPQDPADDAAARDDSVAGAQDSDKQDKASRAAGQQATQQPPGEAQKDQGDPGEQPSPAADEAFATRSHDSTPAPDLSRVGPRPAPRTGLESGSRDRPVHASPSVRKFARELGVNLDQVQATGPRGRILREDVQGFVKQTLRRSEAQAPGGDAGIPPIPAVDFSRFGEIERRPLSRVQRKAGPNLHRSWLNIPHVTQFEDADVTELEAYRKALQGEAGRRGVKLTMLALLINLCATALREFPRVNGSLDPDGAHLIYKHYVHMGIAVDTPDGLLVPVIRDADRKGVFEIAGEAAELASLARDGKLQAQQMQGGSFSISSLGGIGGTAFTPIINAPQAGILGVSRMQTRPVYVDDALQPRKILPLSFSYDHRIIDGAEAARFTSRLAALLADPHALTLE